MDPAYPIGNAALALALAAAGWAVVAGAAAARTGRLDLLDSGERALRVVLAANLVAAASLQVLLFGRDFRAAYVWQYTSATLPAPYTFAAWWAGQAGSLQLWSTVLAAVSVAAVARRRDRFPDLAPHVVWALGLIAVFFLVLTNFYARPFETIYEKYGADVPPGYVPPDGEGMNPLLQHPAMTIHPPILYLGYISWAVPFAFAVAALAARRLDADWTRAVRRWALFAWIFNGAGLALGGAWAYVELGWGGYWGWDPVENAALMPFLAGTAYIHSVMITERRGILRGWNVGLVALAFVLSILGTFLTRSGILSSVHAFAQSDVKDPFLAFLSFVSVGTVLLMVSRRADLRGAGRIPSVVSREAAFLANNVLLLSMTLAVLVGTLYPLLSEAATGERIVVGPAYFNRVFLPMGILLLVLTGIGTVIPWGRSSWAALRSQFAAPAAVAAALAAAAAAAGVRRPLPLATVAACAFLAAVTLLDTARAVAARARATGEDLLAAAGRLFARHRRRYGGYLAHMGVVLFALGVAGAAYTVEAEGHLEPGERIAVGRYDVEFVRGAIRETPHRTILAADVVVHEGGRPVRRMRPEISIFNPRHPDPSKRQVASEVAVWVRPREDLYLVLAGLDAAEGTGAGATLRVAVNPWISLVWVGACVVVVGAAFAAWPERRR